MIRKISLILISLILSAAAASAYSPSYQNVLWGIKGKINIELPGKWKGDIASVKMFNPGFGCDLGAVCNISLGKSFYLEPAAGFFYEGYRYDDLIISGSDGVYKEHNPQLYKLGVRVPVVAGYTFDISDRVGFSIFTGPQFSYALRMKIKTKHPELIDGFDLAEMGAQRRFDIAWKAGIGFPVDSYMISLEADFGITDHLKGNMKFRENRLGIAFTYYF